MSYHLIKFDIVMVKASLEYPPRLMNLAFWGMCGLSDDGDRNSHKNATQSIIGPGWHSLYTKSCLREFPFSGYRMVTNSSAALG